VDYYCVVVWNCGSIPKPGRQLIGAPVWQRLWNPPNVPDTAHLEIVIAVPASPGTNSQKMRRGGDESRILLFHADGHIHSFLHEKTKTVIWYS
jgi:hypothetical protein